MVRVLVFGVFDGLHPGHISFLAQAKRLGSELIVVVTRDARCRKEGKCPQLNERERQRLVAAVRYVDRAMLGDTLATYGALIRRVRPDVLALGYDQPGKLMEVRSWLREHGCSRTRVTRLRRHADGRHHTSMLFRRTRRF